MGRTKGRVSPESCFLPGVEEIPAWMAMFPTLPVGMLEIPTCCRLNNADLHKDLEDKRP